MSTVIRTLLYIHVVQCTAGTAAYLKASKRCPVPQQQGSNAASLFSHNASLTHPLLTCHEPTVNALFPPLQVPCGYGIACNDANETTRLELLLELYLACCR